MTTRSSDNELDVTVRELASGQKVFGRFTLKRILGRGGMGIVWLARDEELERDVALKFLPDLVVLDKALLSDLKRETRRSLELTHKNIVRIYDFVQSENSACISMEYIDGDTLSNLRAEKEGKVFQPDEIAAWTSHLCAGLDYAHNHARIIHRDLKPDNLMVNQQHFLPSARVWTVRRQLNFVMRRSERCLESFDERLCDRTSRALAKTGQVQVPTLVLHCRSGDRDETLQAIAELAKNPMGIDYGTLRFDPEWDSLRSYPRFERIVAELQPK